MVAFVPHKPWMESQFDGSLANTPVDFDTDSLRVALIDDTLAPDPTAHDLWGDLVANEVTGTNYTAGGFDFTTPTLALDSGVVKFDAEDATWAQHASGFTDARYAILLAYDAGTPNNSPIIASADLGSNKGNVAGALTFQWAATGISENCGGLNGQTRWRHHGPVLGARERHPSAF